jgi:hypothetical protein
MVQGIETLGTNFKVTFINGPSEHNRLREGEIEVRLSGTVHKSGCAIPKRCSDAIRPDNWRPRKAGGLEMVSQFRLHRPSLDQLVFRAGSAQLGTVSAYSKNVVGIGG